MKRRPRQESRQSDRSGFMCDHKLQHRLKIKIYCTVTQSILIYGAETWALKRNEFMKPEMGMIRWAMGSSLKEHKTNEEVRQLAGVEEIEEKLSDVRLRWYGDVQRRGNDHCLIKHAEFPDPVNRNRGRPSNRWTDSVEKRERVEEEDVRPEHVTTSRGDRRRCYTIIIFLQLRCFVQSLTISILDQ